VEVEAVYPSSNHKNGRMSTPQPGAFSSAADPKSSLAMLVRRKVLRTRVGAN
jgi:hypothetical protein